MSAEEKLRAVLQNVEGKLTAWRRAFHERAEIGWCEYETTYAIYEALAPLSFKLFTGQDVTKADSRMGLPATDVDEAYAQAAAKTVPAEFLASISGGHTGVVAVLQTGQPGPHTALRFDIDALPITESTDADHLPVAAGFRARHEGAMHACAHDGHITIGLGVAHVLEALKDELAGTYTLIFQPAEEGSRGAKSIVDNGWLDGVDQFLSGHIGIQSLNVGQVAATATQFLATTKIDCTYKGTSAHAGMNPHEGSDALLAGAAAAVHLQAIPPHPDGITRLNVGTLHAGSGRNIIADQAKLEIETRGETTALNQYVVDKAVDILSGAAKMHGVTEEIQFVGEGVAADCDQAWIERIKRVVRASSRAIDVIDALPVRASEDVTHMMKRVQENGGTATYLLFGTPLSYNHHHPKFDFAEATLAVAVETLVRTVLEAAPRQEEAGQ
ncbi:amidohydrolase [Salisediminibacterium halotolerans]|uniref:Aminobenzoyl-glutamate utilization protein A n=1 Tax=Salisediminibacterium halotolerans TaxID=517425 RepID=A0A1H9W3D7_9BACI|nr:amidohydrolase [Salisediminibacterium haloalkalitolerans]SES28432.1 aminobenzoyl-glutamate utilization protein A [Salisediminibacterium haloalkalitolerans]